MRIRRVSMFVKLLVLLPAASFVFLLLLTANQISSDAESYMRKLNEKEQRLRMEERERHVALLRQEEEAKKHREEIERVNRVGVPPDGADDHDHVKKVDDFNLRDTHGGRKQDQEMQVQKAEEDVDLGGMLTLPPVVNEEEKKGEDSGKAQLVPVLHVEDDPDVDPSAPGYMGKGVDIDKDKLGPEERKKYDAGWKSNSYNLYVADMIPVRRPLPDMRDPECKSVLYPASMPDTSVVVIFYNEAWTVLLRTVHSIIDRSPPKLLNEIILVDDFSDRPHLGQPLEDYMEKLEKVRIVRTKEREGLIRARMLGASVAKGKVLTFLDSHIECAPGWLEPLMGAIALDPTHVICPIIDVIKDTTMAFEHLPAKHTAVGGFKVARDQLTFIWKGPHFKRERLTDPILSPTMAGGLFSISRDYFNHLGKYDSGMDIWGSENLELSFRIWMCGGRLSISPCSHVGHIFRKYMPYTVDGNIHKILKKNSVRLAEVWMDDYKNDFYRKLNYDLGEYGDVTERKELRKKLNCTSFSWYLRNIYPDMFMASDAKFGGQIRNPSRGVCLDARDVEEPSQKTELRAFPCHGKRGPQDWFLSNNDEIRRDLGCLDASGGMGAVMVYPCHGQRRNQRWQMTTDQKISMPLYHLCLTLEPDGATIRLNPCYPNLPSQVWLFERI